MKLTRAIAKQFAKPEGIAGKLSTLLMNIGNQSLYHSVWSQLPRNKSKHILDVGYGNGYLLKKLLRNDYQHVTGLEISSDMQNLVAEKLRYDIDQQRCQLILSPLETVIFSEQQFDVIYSINTIYFWTSLEAGLSKLYQSVNDQGRVILAFYDRRLLMKLPSTKYGFHMYENQFIEEQIRYCGFRVEKIVKKGFGMGLCYILKK